MNKCLTWIGPQDGSGAYPTINRQLTAALERAGWQVLRNVHNDGAAVTPWSVSHIYPLRPVNVRHAQNVGLAVWEFTGAQGVPRTFRQAFKTFDWIGAPSAWVADQFSTVMDTPVQAVQWGFDPEEFTITRERAARPDCDHLLLWVGGTDPRHGFDVALNVMDRLSDGYHLIAKQSAHYPAAGADHPRVTIIRDDLPSLAPYYRAADALLHTARGVGFSLPVLEALACGCPVASTDLPPLHDFAPAGRVVWAGGTWQSMGRHHVHPDCRPVWLEPDVEALVQAVEQAAALPRAVDLSWRQAWTWDAAAVRLGQLLEVKT